MRTYAVPAFPLQQQNLALRVETGHSLRVAVTEFLGYAFPQVPKAVCQGVGQALFDFLAAHAELALKAAQQQQESPDDDTSDAMEYLEDLIARKDSLVGQLMEAEAGLAKLDCGLPGGDGLAQFMGAMLQPVRQQLQHVTEEILQLQERLGLSERSRIVLPESDIILPGGSL